MPYIFNGTQTNASNSSIMNPTTTTTSGTGKYGNVGGTAGRRNNTGCPCNPNSSSKGGKK